MKKLVIGLLFAAGVAGASCMGPYCWDDTGASLSSSLSLPVVSFTIATSTPIYVNDLVVDSTYHVYISTCTTNTSCWVKVGSQ